MQVQGQQMAVYDVQGPVRAPQIWRPGMRKLNLDVAGHSFIKRLRQFVASTPGYNTDMSLQFAVINWVTRGGWTLDRFRDEPDGLEAMKSRSPDLAYLEFGTNQLDTDEDEESVAQCALFIIDELIKAGVKRVIIAHVLPRNKKYNLPKWIFNQKVRNYNEFMCKKLRNTHVRRKSSPSYFKDNKKWWWEHKRMRSSQFSVTRPDGVHISEYHMENHYRSVRHALLAGTKYLQ